jgi:hypothetical protein
VMTPHVATCAPEVQSAGAMLPQRNIELFLSGQPVLTPMPELGSRHPCIPTEENSVPLET